MIVLVYVLIVVEWKVAADSAAKAGSMEAAQSCLDEQAPIQLVVQISRDAFTWPPLNGCWSLRPKFYEYKVHKCPAASPGPLRLAVPAVLPLLMWSQLLLFPQLLRSQLLLLG